LNLESRAHHLSSFFSSSVRLGLFVVYEIFMKIERNGRRSRESGAEKSIIDILTLHNELVSQRISEIFCLLKPRSESRREIHESDPG
jgi:hypothetical protein